MTVSEGGQSMKNFIGDFLMRELDNFLHRNSTTADAIKRRIEQNERERKELAGIKKLANEGRKKANLHNKKLRIVNFTIMMSPPEKTRTTS
jgi:topoisomerase-4 subunit B